MVDQRHFGAPDAVGGADGYPALPGPAGNQKANDSPFCEESVDEVNARWQAASQERSLDIIWQDFLGVRKQTIRRANEFTNQELNNPKLFPWQRDMPLWEWIANDSFGHDEEHGGQIAEWLERRDSRNNGHGAK